MKIGWKRGFGVVAVAAAALIVAGGAVAVADAAHGRAAKKAAKRHVAKRLVRAGVHADVSLIRADGTTDAFAVDRGKASTSSSTLADACFAPTGRPSRSSLTSSTIVRGTITTGRPVLVFSRSGVAFRIAAPGRMPGARSCLRRQQVADRPPARRASCAPTARPTRPRSTAAR